MRKIKHSAFACILVLSVSCGSEISDSGSNSSLSGFDYGSAVADSTNDVTVCENLIAKAAKRDRILNIIKGLFNIALSAVPAVDIDLNKVFNVAKGTFSTTANSTTNTLVNGAISFGESEVMDNTIFKEQEEKITEDCNPTEIKLNKLTEMINEVYIDLKKSIQELQDTIFSDQSLRVNNQFDKILDNYMKIATDPELYFEDKGETIVLDKANYKREKCDEIDSLEASTKCEFSLTDSYKATLKKNYKNKNLTIKTRMKDSTFDGFTGSMDSLLSELKGFRQNSLNKMLKPHEDLFSSDMGATLPGITQATTMTLLPGVFYGLTLPGSFYSRISKVDLTYSSTDADVKKKYEDISKILYNMLADVDAVIRYGVDMKVDEKMDNAMPQITIPFKDDIPLFKIRDRKQGTGGNKDSASDFEKEWGIDDVDNNWHSISEFAPNKNGDFSRETRYPTDQSDRWENFEILFDEKEAGITYVVSVFGKNGGYNYSKGILDLKGRSLKMSLPLTEEVKKNVITTGYTGNDGKAVKIYQFDMNYYKSKEFKEALSKAIVAKVLDGSWDDRSGAKDAKGDEMNAYNDWDALRYLGGSEEEGRSIDSVMSRIKELAKAAGAKEPEREACRPDKPGC